MNNIIHNAVLFINWIDGETSTYIYDINDGRFHYKNNYYYVYTKENIYSLTIIANKLSLNPLINKWSIEKGGLYNVEAIKNKLY